MYLPRTHHMLSPCTKGILLEGDDQKGSDRSYCRPAALNKPLSLQQAIALSLRELVHTHITDKNYETTYASASETARTLILPQPQPQSQPQSQPLPLSQPQSQPQP